MTDPRLERIFDAAREYEAAYRRGEKATIWMPLRMNVATVAIDALTAPEPEQAILRYHPDVVRLVEAARRAEWVQGFYQESGHLFWSCPDCGAEADWRGNGRIAGKHEPDCTLAAALVPFTTEEESE